MAKNNPSIEYLRHLYNQQRKAESKADRLWARNQLLDLTRQMQATANGRLRSLRASDYDYGSTYDATATYLDQRGLKYFKLPAEARKTGARRDPSTKELYPLTNDTYDYAIRLHGFLESKETTVRGQREIENLRFETYRKQFPYARDMTNATLRDFLRFLGNSGVQDYLDKFGGTSDEEVEELAHYFSKTNDAEERKLFTLFNDFKKYNEEAERLKKGEIDEIPEDLQRFKPSNFRKELDKLYESIEKRSR